VGQFSLLYSQELITMYKYVRVHPDSVTLPSDYTPCHHGIEIKLHGAQNRTPDGDEYKLSRSGRFTPGEITAACVYNTIPTVLDDLHTNSKVSLYIHTG
jgi:hypothetical protein